jgi:intraflagellar transport protein 172
MIAYLIDPTTIIIQNLVSQESISLTNDSNIDFIDFNKNGSKLIIRDANRQLFIYDIDIRKKHSLLILCGFVQWISLTNILVAQDGKNLCIWYDINDLQNMKAVAIRGDIDEVRRKDNKTEVIITDEGGDNKVYPLDSDLINISLAIDNNDLSKAASILEYIGQKPEADMFWKSLAKKALVEKNLVIAQHCFASLGNYSKTNYIKKLIKEANDVGIDNPLINAKILYLNNKQTEAERILQFYGIDKSLVFK